MDGVDPLVARVAGALLERNHDLHELHHKHIRLDANAAYFIADVAVETMRADADGLRSLLGRLAEPWAPWRWDGVGDGICCNRCSGYKPTHDLAHTRDLDWHDQSCPWRQAREALA